MGFRTSKFRNEKQTDYNAEIFVDQPLPRRIQPSDIDMMFHNANTHRMLLIEVKPDGVPIPTGQKIWLKDGEYDEKSVNPVKIDTGVIRVNPDGDFVSFAYHGDVIDDEQEFWEIVKGFVG